MRSRTPMATRFWSKVAIAADPNECWPWIGATRNGYGAIGRGGRTDGIEYAHRYSFTEAGGFLADGEEVCHRCNNRLCVNPLHMYAGTRSDNMAQCASQGRHRGAAGKTWRVVDGRRVYSDRA